MATCSNVQSINPIELSRVQASLFALLEDHFYFRTVPSLQRKSAKVQKAERLDKSFYHTRGVSLNESCPLFR